MNDQRTDAKRIIETKPQRAEQYKEDKFSEEDAIFFICALLAFAIEEFRGPRSVTSIRAFSLCFAGHNLPLV